MTVQYFVKAVYAGAVAFLGSLLTGMQAGELTGIVWVTISLATVLAIGGVLGLQAAPASIAVSVPKE